LFGAPVVAGVAAVGPELLPSLASARYASAAVILPWVIAGMVVDGTNAMVGAGLFIHKKTRRIMAIVMSGAIFNIVLNLLLIPHYGILGSAIATLAAYCFASFSLAAAGHQLLPVTLPWSTLVRASAGAGVMYLAVFRLMPGHRFLSVGVRTAVGGLVYAAVMALIDRDARALLMSAAERLRPRRRTS